jgi:hypothetical protein
MVVDGLVALGVALALALGLAGSIAIPWGWWELEAARESVSWPSTPGVILSSRATSASTSSDLRQRDTRATMALVYGYTVDGVDHEGVRVAFGQEDREWPDLVVAHREIQAMYPTGGEVRVYCRPSDPGTSVLEPGAADAGGPLAFGLAAGGISLLLWILLGIRALILRFGAS